MVLVVMKEKREIKDNGRERSENSYKNILQVAVPVPVPVLLHVHGDQSCTCFLSLCWVGFETSAYIILR